MGKRRSYVLAFSGTDLDFDVEGPALDKNLKFDVILYSNWFLIN